MLPIDPANQEKLNKELGTSSLTIPAGTYSFQKEDCPTVSSQLLLITSADQPDEVITGVLKAMTANIAYLHSVHANLRDLSPETMSAANSRSNCRILPGGLHRPPCAGIFPAGLDSSLKNGP